jgi:hypothetical protein
MKRNFTQALWSLFLICSLGILLNPTEIIAQSCATPTGINTSNVSNLTATANWNLDITADHYRIRYKSVSASNWSFQHNVIGVNYDFVDLNANSQYIWQSKAFCSLGNSNSSLWSVIDTFLTTNYSIDCNSELNGTAYVDSCGNCVEGSTGKLPCIDFSPNVSMFLNNSECSSLTNFSFSFSQYPNEPDVSSAVFSSDGGHFDLSGINLNDTVGSSINIAAGGQLNVTTTLLVDFIINSDKITIKSVDDITSQILSSFTIENVSGGILVIANSLPDNNNVTSGNSQSFILSDLFINPPAGTLTFTSTINSELGDVDVQTFLNTIVCTDCNGDVGGTAFTDSCGNCVGGNTGDVSCIPFTPTVSVSLSNTDCDSLADLTINVSQDPNEPDMFTSSFVSDGGSFAISLMNIGDTVGSAIMSGIFTFNTALIVNSIPNSNQAILQSIDIVSGVLLGNFTISNSIPGVSITVQSPADNNNITSGNSQSITFSNVFINPPAGTLTFTSTINSELGDVDVQTFSFTIVCLCQPNGSFSYATSCDEYTWNGTAYTTSGVYTYSTTNSNGCDSTATLNLTINPSTISTANVTECDTYSWNGTAYTSSGTYTYSTTNSNGCDSTATLNLTINPSTTSTSSATACDSLVWNGTTYLASGTYTYSTTNSNGCDSTATLNLTIAPNGCTDSTASNYDVNATCDDGSCIFTPICPQLGDANCDSIVNLADLTLVLNHWLQSTVAGHDGDVVGSLDGFVNLTDLTLVLNNWLQSTP